MAVAARRLDGFATAASSEMIRQWAIGLGDHLAAHLALLRRGDVEALVDLAHDIGDLRASGFVQADSGRQRRVPVAATAGASNRPGGRLEVARDLDRQLRRQRPTTPLVTASDHATMYVTHIQRCGMDRADHVVICRTLRRHMPFTGPDRFGLRSDRMAEQRLMYRALRSGGRSVHMLSAGQSPFLGLFDTVVDHRL